MDTNNEPIIPITPPKIEIDPHRLLAALYYIWDAFERSSLPFFLVKETAESVMKQHDLKGDKIDVGVRDMEWRGGSERIFKTFMGEAEIETDSEAIYTFEGVPIVVHIYPDHECLRQTDNILYKNEDFRVPNPYSQFKQLYG